MIFNKKTLGGAVIISINFLVLSLWILSKPDISSISDNPLFSLGQATALLGATLLSLNYILAARLRFLESYFGGLDKMYRIHRLIGSLGFVTICFHPIFLAMNSFSATNAIRYFVPSSNIPYALGLFSFYAYALLIVATTHLKLPYHIWKITHKFMGVPFVLFALHMIFIPTNLHNYLPLQIVLSLVTGTGLAAYIYKLFFYNRYGPKFNYQIKKASRLEKITELILKPVGKNLPFVPGQFVFVKFENRAIGKESHPFSISSGKEEPYLRLSIKSLGDYTDRVQLLKPGETVQVYGPYGTFHYDNNEESDQIWIGGGIGITPFLSMLRAIPKKTASQIWLFYCTRNKSDAPYLPEINGEKEKLNSLYFTHHASEDQGRITYAHIKEQAATLKDKKIFLCGPRGMMENLANEFMTNGVRARNIQYEDFSFLT